MATRKEPEQQRWRDVIGPIEPPRPAPVPKDPQRRYTEEEKIATKALIVERVAGGEFLEHICEAADLPTVRTIYRWLHEDVQFGNEMNVAQKMLAGKLMADTIRIADDSSQDFDENGKPKWETIQRSTLRCKQREAIASKLDRNRWGDENVTTIKGDANSPLVIEDTATAQERRLEAFVGMLSAMSIPDIASVGSFLWGIAASAVAYWQWRKRTQSDVLTHRFLVGLKASATPQQSKQINDELERIKPSAKKTPLIASRS
jgi:hypothetical protein